MLDLFLSWYQTLLDSAKQWPAAQAAIVTTSSVAAAGAVGFLLWKLPSRLIHFFKTQCTTKLSFSTASTSWSSYNSTQYIAFLRWFSKNSWFNWSRVITLDGNDSSNGAVGPGVGNHFFVFKRRLFVFTIAEDQANQSGQAKYRISITTLGRSKGPLYKLMSEFMEKDTHGEMITVFENSKSDWNWVAQTHKRDLSTVIYPPNIQDELIDPILKFTESRDWYLKRGLNYKVAILLYGPPGTGKSSLALAIASLLGRNLYILKPDGSCSYNALFQGAKGGLVLMEDIDTYGISRSRDNNGTDAKLGVVKLKESKKEEGEAIPVAPGGASTHDSLSEYMSGSLSELLNGLDGVLGLDDVVVLMTANHPEVLDEALIRDGRVDLRVEVPYLGNAEIHRYVQMMFPNEPYDATRVFGSLPGATVQKQFKLNTTSLSGFVNALHKEVEKREKVA